MSFRWTDGAFQSLPGGTSETPGMQGVGPAWTKYTEVGKSNAAAEGIRTSGLGGVEAHSL